MSYMCLENCTMALVSFLLAVYKQEGGFLNTLRLLWNGFYLSPCLSRSPSFSFSLSLSLSLCLSASLSFSLCSPSLPLSLSLSLSLSVFLPLHLSLLLSFSLSLSLSVCLSFHPAHLPCFPGSYKNPALSRKCVLCCNPAFVKICVSTST